MELVTARQCARIILNVTTGVTGMKKEESIGRYNSFTIVSESIPWDIGISQVKTFAKYYLFCNFLALIALETFGFVFMKYCV